MHDQGYDGRSRKTRGWIKKGLPEDVVFKVFKTRRLKSQNWYGEVGGLDAFTDPGGK